MLKIIQIGASFVVDLLWIDEWVDFFFYGLDFISMIDSRISFLIFASVRY